MMAVRAAARIFVRAVGMMNSVGDAGGPFRLGIPWPPRHAAEVPTGTGKTGFVAGNHEKTKTPGNTGGLGIASA